MSLNILLVDDEFIVLKGLEAMLLNQQEVDVRITLAVDAVDALQKLPLSHPDVIITDINMPEVDGLSMIDKIVIQNYYCKFIIISGYEKLEYLKKAIQLHVSDYLFKPVDKVHLINKLVEFDKEKSERIHLSLFKLKMFFLHGERAEDCSLTDEEIMLAFPWPYFAFCISIHNPQQTNFDIKNFLLQYFDNIHYFTQCSQTVFLLNFSSRLKIKEIRHIWELCVPNHPVGLTVANTNIQPNTLIQQDLSLMYSYSLIDLILQILPISSELKQTVQTQINLSPDTLSIASRVLQNDCPLNDYMEALYLSGHSLQEIHLKAFTEIFVCYFSIIGINMSEEYIIQIYQRQTIKINDQQSLTLFLQDMLTNFWHTMPDQMEQSNYSEKICLVRTYIQQHFDEDLSLEQVAEQVNFNPSYLSYIFKKEVGITFLQFLNEIRLKKACKLLKSSSGKSVEAIAAQVGYRSATYFHKIFRSHIGMSPKQWQQQNE